LAANAATVPPATIAFTLSRSGGGNSSPSTLAISRKLIFVASGSLRTNGPNFLPADMPQQPVGHVYVRFFGLGRLGGSLDDGTTRTIQCGGIIASRLGCRTNVRLSKPVVMIYDEATQPTGPLAPNGGLPIRLTYTFIGSVSFRHVSHRPSVSFRHSSALSPVSMDHYRSVDMIFL